VLTSQLNHGLALSNDGRTIFASSVEAVFAWDYDAESGAVTGLPRRLIANLSNSDLVTRTLLVSKKAEGMLLVSRGGDEEDGAASEVVSNGFSQIRAFNLTNLASTTSTDPSAHYYNFPTDGRVLGWGLRDSIGMAAHPVTGGIYAVENSVDRIERNGADLGDDNPGEELNFLGVLLNDTTTTTTTNNNNNQTDMATNKPNFGYPQCVAIWDLAAIPANERDDDRLAVGTQIAVHGNTHTDQMCAARYYAPPRLTFPAHYAPIDIIFDAGGEVAFVSFRGSCEFRFFPFPLSPCHCVC
jgi:glucose/arabinose dehydrogenase